MEMRLPPSAMTVLTSIEEPRKKLCVSPENETIEVKKTNALF